MPFLIELTLPMDTPACRMEKFLAEPGVYIDWNCPVARICSAERVASLVCNMPVVICSWIVKEGDALEPGQIIAQAEAEGDEIPYGKENMRII